MNSFLLYPNARKPDAYELACQVRDYLNVHGFKVACAGELADQIGGVSLEQIAPDELVAAIAIGGDGTLLRMAKECPYWQVPVLGINLGSLGFMSEVPREGVKAALKALVTGQFSVQERLMLEVRVGGECFWAINEACVARGQQHGLIELLVQIDGRFVSAFYADGLIVATPNGSTAYSLSAGGPIIEPTMDCLLVTPICPHTISNRPLVIHPHSHLSLQYAGQISPADLVVDGVVVMQLQPSTEVRLQQASRRFRWICLEGHDYYQTLRSKLRWNSQLR